MLDSLINCKSPVFFLAAVLTVATIPALAQQTPPLTRSQMLKNNELVSRQREIVDAAEAEAFGKLVAAYSALFRQREKDDDNKKEIARIQKELAEAESVYRNIVAGWSRAQALGSDTAKFDPGFLSNAYGKAITELDLEIRRAPALLQRDMDRATGDENSEARKGAARGRIRAAYLKATVAAEQWAAFEPSTEKAFVPTQISGTPILPGLRFSTLLAHMAWLAERVATLDPNNIVVPVEIRPSTLRFIVQTDRDAALEEFQRLARTGLLVEMGNHRPVQGQRRTDLAKVLESNMQEYVATRGSQQSEFTRLLWRADDRLRLSKQIESEIKQSPEYRISGYLSAGLEPSFKEYFLAAALAVSQSQLEFREKFNREYLGEGFWNTGLGQLLRANDFPGTRAAGYEEVIKRVNKAVADGDVLVKAFRAAAFADSPEDLKTAPNRYALLKNFGYIVEYTAKDGKKKSSFRIPGTRRSLGHRLRSDASAAKIPGASFLDVITPKSVAITLASMVIPELGAAWLTSGAAAFTTTTGGLLAVRAVAEMGVGFYLDTAIEKCEKGNKDKKLPAGSLSSSAAFFENCYGGNVDYQKLILESVVLGSLIQVSGAKTSELLEWMNWRKQRGLNPDRLYKSVETALRKEPEIGEKIWKFVGDEVIGLAQETAITESFQMASEGRDFDINTMMSTLVNNMLSRKMGKYKESLQNVIRRPDVPRVVRDMVESDPVIRREVQENHARRLAEQAEVRQRYEALTKDTAQPGRKVFESLLNGDLTWTELKNLFAATPEKMGMVMQEVADRREHFFIKIIEQARRRSIDDVEAFFVQRVEAAVKEAGSREAAKDKIVALEARRRAELDLINAEIKTPGSKNPTSDIDRSSSSAFLRKNLIHLYEAHARWLVDGDLPTSAKAFDVNEYINVFPFITENAGLVTEIKKMTTPDGMPHPDYMEAMSLGGAIQHMSKEQGDNYIQGQRMVIAKAVAEGRATQKALDDFNRIVDLAQTTLQTSRGRLDGYAREFARQEGKDPADPEMQLKAKEHMYDLRMKEIRELQYELSALEAKHGGNQKHPDAIKLRASIERKMSMAMRDGIETYSYTVGLDIIVNRVQASEKVPRLDSDGNPVIGPDGKPEMRSKTVADRLMEPGFRIGEGGELHMYTEQDMRAVLNDQVMFIAEHINHFNSGHESTYLAGRGIGKYTERAFLAMKIMGLDIGEVRGRNEHDPTRRLLELSQKMAELKNDPQGMNELLASISRREPMSPENGLAEIMHMIEQVIPGMEGLTGVVPPKPEPGVEIVQEAALNPYARPARNSAAQKEVQRLEMLFEGAGAKVAKDYLEQEIRFTEIEITAMEKEIKQMQDIASEYRLLDWDKIRKLKAQVAGLAVQKQVLLWNTSRSATSRRIGQALTAAEQRLESARTERTDGDIHQLLYGDPSAWAYRRIWNRLDWLRYRLAWLKSQLPASQKKAQTEAVLEGLDLSGAWSCGRENHHDFDIELKHDDAKITGTIAGREGSGLGSRPTLESSYVRGALSGFWTDTAKQTEKLDLPVDPGPTRMMFKALADPGGKKFQFTYAPKHPRIAFSLQDVICDRGQRQASAPPEFLELKQLSIPAGNPAAWKLEPGEGWVRAAISATGGAQKPAEFILLKGRQRVKSSRGSRVRVAAGDYTIVIRLGGRQTRKNIAVTAGSLNELQVNAGTLTVNSLTTNGESLSDGFKVFDPEDKAHQGALMEAMTGDPVTLTPGSYTVIVGEYTGFPLVMDVALAAGESLSLDARWKQIEVPFIANLSGSEFVFLREEVEGADTSDWRSVTSPQIRRTGNGAIVYVPEGTYSARSHEDEIVTGLKAK